MRPASQGAREIPRARINIDNRIEEAPLAKGLESDGRRPFLGRSFRYLHKADFAARSDLAGPEAAFLPDDGDNEVGVHAVTAAGGADERTVLSGQPPFGSRDSDGRHRRQNKIDTDNCPRQSFRNDDHTSAG